VIGRCDYYERAYVPGPCANPLHALGSGNHLQHPHLPGIMMERPASPECEIASGKTGHTKCFDSALEPSLPQLLQFYLGLKGSDLNSLNTALPVRLNLQLAGSLRNHSSELRELV
jgi:hypothetical protein